MSSSTSFLPAKNVCFQFCFKLNSEKTWLASSSQADTFWSWMDKGLRKSRQRWACTWDWDLWFHFCSPSTITRAPPHHRARVQWCGCAASPRGMQDWELSRELANFRWIQLGGVFSLEKPKVSVGTMNQGRQRGYRCRQILNQLFHSMFCVNWGKKAATCVWGSTHRGFA